MLYFVTNSALRIASGFIRLSSFTVSSLKSQEAPNGISTPMTWLGLATTYSRPEYLVGSDVAAVMDSDNAPKPDSSAFDKALQEYLEGDEDVEHTILIIDLILGTLQKLLEGLIFTHRLF